MGLGWGMFGCSRFRTIWRQCDITNVCIIASSEDWSLGHWRRQGTLVSNILVRNQWAMHYCGSSKGLAGHIARQAIGKNGVVRAFTAKCLYERDLVNDIETIESEDVISRTSRMFDDSDSFLILPGTWSRRGRAPWRSSRRTVAECLVGQSRRV